MNLIDRAKKLLDMDRRVSGLEAAIERLVLENTELSEERDRFKTRAENLEAALSRLVKLAGPIVTGGDEVAVYRACKAVLEDDSWKR